MGSRDPYASVGRRIPRSAEGELPEVYPKHYTPNGYVGSCMRGFFDCPSRPGSKVIVYSLAEREQQKALEAQERQEREAKQAEAARQDALKHIALAIRTGEIPRAKEPYPEIKLFAFLVLNNAQARSYRQA